MFYRRKIILALLQIFDGQLEKIRLQKLLFLLSQRQQKPEYDFVPYKYGCYSYSASADLVAMVNKGMLIDNAEGYKKNDITDYFKSLKEVDRKLIFDVKRLYGQMNGNALMKHTYVNFPFFAINSVKANDILSEDELLKVKNSRPALEKTILYTIGYEGLSLEEYLSRLLKNDVKILIDVRNNPLSMKYGFSKTLLKKFVESIGIQYIHYPDVGIQSDQRQELNNQADYDILFMKYKKNNLANTINTQVEILDLLKKNKRIALTCFEANICQCHRKHLAEAIKSLPGFEYEVKHI
jgi:uncharacterized protein (DUF488 family)